MPLLTKKYFFLLLTALTAAISSLSADKADAQNTWNNDWSPAHNIVWEGKLRRQVEFLSDTICSGRATGTRGSAEAAFSIIRNFKKAGLLPFDGCFGKHIYAGNGIVGHNIIGMMPGSKKYKIDSYVIVGAHYDHIGTIDGRMYPGADSNASGTVSMMTIAEMFATMKTVGKNFNSNIIFVAFDARELSLAGSESLWRIIDSGELHNPQTGESITRDKIRLMVNIDQIGSSLSPLSSGREDFIIMLGAHSLPMFRDGLLGICNRHFGTDLELSNSYYGSENFTKVFYTLSDQKHFVEHRIPAVLFTSGITMNNNKVYDTASTLNYEVLRRRIILMFHWIEKML